MGHKWDAKAKEMFQLEVKDWETLLLDTAGLRPKDVQHVILTHLHFDHAGGLTRLNEDRKTLSPVFKNAQHWVQKSNFVYACDPNPRERASYREENWSAWVERDQLEIVEQDLKEEARQILPGLFVERSDGHTIGQQIVHITPSTGDHLVYAGDLLPTQHHIKESWGMGYDSQPLLLLEEKRSLLERAALKNWGIILEHDSECPLIRVEKESIRGRVDFRATLF
jgi:glyoxylase-like metal-dependent hydrolase (beta-lactamase superfamily II)